MLMMRLRRHRAPIAVAIFLIIGLYQFASLRSTSPAHSFPPDRLREHNTPLVVHEPAIPPPVAPPIVPDSTAEKEGKKEKEKEKADDKEKEEKVDPSKPKVETPAEKIATEAPALNTIPDRPAQPGGHAHSEAEQHPLPEPEERYAFPKPFYPLPSPLINIPPAAAAAIPQIQAQFPAESEADKKTRLARQKAVKDSFLVSWTAYRVHAIPHDELVPVSGTFKDPFGGWGATLVDALDTLWIMDLKDEFKEAVGYVAKIDFATTTMRKMRVFETVIRYLGGLVAAYDLTGHDPEYKVLLDKAVELANVLMGAFDTPNRMPLLAFGWRQRDLIRHPRANGHSSAAELGSLAMEFTRLAQITGNHTYYDAVARITNALDEYQDKTSFPGLFPLYIDASGCKRVSYTTTTTTTQAASAATKEPIKPQTEPAPPVDERPLKVAGVVGGTGKEVNSSVEKAIPHKAASEPAVPPPAGGETEEAPVHHAKRESPAADIGAGVELEEEVKEKSTGRPSEIEKQQRNPTKPPPKKECEEQGLASPHLGREDTYSLGAMIDSLYEYLLKQYLLIGGHEQYSKMYSKFANVAGTELTFRPQVPGNPDILLAGKVNVKRIGGRRSFEPESSHLACFAGGMFAMGSLALNRPKDLDIGAKLTDGCVWAYDSMRSGVMPESFRVMPCGDKKTCTYSRDAWVHELEPSEEFVEVQNEPGKGHTSPEAILTPGDKVPEGATEPAAEVKSKADVPAAEVKNKADVPEPPPVDDPSIPVHQPGKRSPQEPKTARDYAEALIAADDLPDGYLSIGDRRYILRPEAIESVWYMYRISADKAWADKGWGMWGHVIKAVSVDGDGKGPASAVADVSLDPSNIDWDWLNSMESFWFGETLKYYYLLFSEPTLVDLDEYVLNTEAHPFRRADYGRRAKKTTA